MVQIANWIVFNYSILGWRPPIFPNRTQKV